MKPLPVALSGYPTRQQDQTAWIVRQRPERTPRDTRAPYATIREQEVGPDGLIWEISTLFLVNKECPFRCLMCDLWKNTTQTRVLPDDIISQIEVGLQQTGHGRAIKLYNSGSWFDTAAVPLEAYERVAQCVAGFERVIVESHCSFIGPHVETFLALLKKHNPSAVLEVAIGLETVHPEVLERLNKRVTTAEFIQAADWLAQRGIALRAFVLLRPPFLTEQEGLEWAKRTLDVALSCGATFTALIPVRGGNGAMETLRANGDWAPPTLASLEAGLRYGLTCITRAAHQRITADIWDIGLFSDENSSKAAEYVDSISKMNRTQHAN